MFKRLVLAGAVLIAACGPSSSGVSSGTPDGSVQPGGGDQPGGTDQPVGTVGLPLTNAAKAKIVLNGTVMSPIQVFDGVDSYGTVSCSTDDECSNFGAAAKCLTVCQAPQASTIYVKNVGPTDAIKVPCLEGTYRAEVFGSTQASSPFVISEAWVLDFKVDAVCAPLNMAGGTIGAQDWTPPADPSIAPSTIYSADLGVPAYATFTVQLTAGYPWSIAGWTLGYAGQATPTTYIGATATFPAPSGTTSLNFVGSVPLDRSLLIGVESWTRPVTKSGQTVIGAVSIGMP